MAKGIRVISLVLVKTGARDFLSSRGVRCIGALMLTNESIGGPLGDAQIGARAGGAAGGTIGGAMGGAGNGVQVRIESNTTQFTTGLALTSI